MAKIHSQMSAYCDQCMQFHRFPCPSPSEIIERCAAERAKWTPLEAERREPGKFMPYELPTFERLRRVVKVEVGRR